MTSAKVVKTSVINNNNPSPGFKPFQLLHSTEEDTNLILSWVLWPLQLVFLFTMVLANFEIPARTPEWPPIV